MFENAAHRFQIYKILMGIWENIHKSQSLALLLLDVISIL